MRTTDKSPSIILRLRTFYYWTLLLAVLLVADDMVFGWVFWVLAQVNYPATIAVAFVCSWIFGYWLTIRGLKPNPGRLAEFMLSRLQLERRHPELRKREQQLRDRFVSVGTAATMTFLFGGVVATLWLYRGGSIHQERAHKLAFWLTGVYAVEFALIHAFAIGGGILWIRQ